MSQIAPFPGAAREFITLTVDGQLFGVPVLQVQDVLRNQHVTRIPLAPPRIAGAMNLRGRMATAVDVRTRLGLKPAPDVSKQTAVVVDFEGELYGLLVDGVGEVLALPAASIGPNPPTLAPIWREISNGVIRLEGELMIVLDIARLLLGGEAEAA
jgi:purine-binding chemotaxis protein CheW